MDALDCIFEHTRALAAVVFLGVFERNVFEKGGHLMSIADADRELIDLPCVDWTKLMPKRE